MTHPYSEDLRWRAIWMKEILGFEVDEVAAALWMLPRTIERYVSKVLNFGDVKAPIIGRPANSVAMHPHIEFLIMEAVLEHPEKMLSAIVQRVRSNWIRISCSKHFLLFATKPFQSKKVLFIIFQCIRNKLQLLK